MHRFDHCSLVGKSSESMRELRPPSPTWQRDHGGLVGGRADARCQGRVCPRPLPPMTDSPVPAAASPAGSPDPTLAAAAPTWATAAVPTCLVPSGGRRGGRRQSGDDRLPLPQANAAGWRWDEASPSRQGSRPVNGAGVWRIEAALVAAPWGGHLMNAGAGADVGYDALEAEV